jgi:divalent anion:Na+ symporter, DASS family
MGSHSSTGAGPLVRSTLLYRWAIVLLVPAALMLLRVPAGVTPSGWRLLAIFAGTILGLILQPLPLGAVALLGVAAASISNALPPAQALSGYADPLVWMVLAAFCISRGMIKTGLGRRIALWFIRAIGRSSIGLGYSVVASDTLLGMVVPSNGARVGGIVFPVVKSLADAYESTPGPTAGRLGAFLMLMVYHCDMTVSAMFFTGNAANPLIVSLAKQVTGIELTYTRWAVGAIVPALASMAVVPMALWRVHPPSIRRTPAAAAFAAAELDRLGPATSAERIMLAVFGITTILYATKTWHGIDYPVTALGGLGALILTGVLTWDDVLAERSAWDTFVWYGAIYAMARALNEAGLSSVFARSVGSLTSGGHWWLVLLLLLVVYLYAHYAFATITAHVSAMYVPFAIVMLAAGTPPILTVLTMAYVSSLGASLTHYGTTSSPIYYGAGYLSQGAWWRVGLIVTTVNGVVWVTCGLVWWKVLGWW